MFDKLKQQVATGKKKAQMVKAGMGILSGEMDMMQILDLLKDFITPDSSKQFAEGLASFINSQEQRHGVGELMFIIRRTPDSQSAYVDAIQLENGEMVKTVEQYSETNLHEIFQNLTNDKKVSE